ASNEEAGPCTRLFCAWRAAPARITAASGSGLANLPAGQTALLLAEEGKAARSARGCPHTAPLPRSCPSPSGRRWRKAPDEGWLSLQEVQHRPDQPQDP